MGVKSLHYKRLYKQNVMISVCIATHNGAEYIKEQLDSIIVQQLNLRIFGKISND